MPWHNKSTKIFEAFAAFWSIPRSCIKRTTSCLCVFLIASKTAPKYCDWSYFVSF